MASATNLQNTEYYSLSELFATPNRRIIIPDFQRDYCWGDEVHGKNKVEIVSGFFDTLKEEVANGETFLGKIDVYQYPEDHIYLTDGQQRLTTLYLIIGMLYRQNVSEEIKSKLKYCLIPANADRNEQDEPYLQYAIRESTLFFLKDLVNEFFLGENSNKAADIKKQNWFFNEYTLDPTINSMLNALEIIEGKLIKFTDLEIFSEFIIEKVKIQYYDVEDRKHGEERFVIINTTGKSLTESENVKPILLGKTADENYSLQWEERETWFWKNRIPGEQIADNGVNDFLLWCFQIFKKQETIDLIKESKELFKKNSDEINTKLDLLDRYFKSMKVLLELLDSNNKIQQQFKFINKNQTVSKIKGIRDLSNDRQQIIVLPLLAFIANISSNENDIYQFLRRLRKNFFDNDRKERKKNYIDWRYVLQVIEQSTSLIECLDFESEYLVQIANVPLPKKKWFNEECELRHKLKEQHQSKIEDWEDFNDFMGDLAPLFKIAHNSHDIQILESFYNTYIGIRNIKHAFFNNVELKNRYSLYDILYHGEWEYRGVGGYGYCMLNRNENFPFLKEDFHEVWMKFNSATANVELLVDYLKNKIQDHFKRRVFNTTENSIENIIKNTKNLDKHILVKVWLVLEVLNAGNKELDFSNSVSCFWQYPNLVRIEFLTEAEFEKNDFQIGNLLLGTSYYNNRTGWLLFDKKFPLMSKLYGNRKITEEDIVLNTNKYGEQLFKEFSN